jgi:hypothetical protein
MRFLEHVERKEQKRNSYRILELKTEEKRPSGKHADVKG